MKILILSSLFPPDYVGGAEVVAHALGRWLAGRGHEVSVLTGIADGGPEREGVDEGGPRVWRMRFPRPYTMRDHHRHGGLRKLEWHARDQLDPGNLAPVRRVLDAVRPDVVNVHGLQGLGYNIPRLLARRGLPVVYSLHDHSLACIRVSLFKDGKRCGRLHAPCAVTQAWKWDGLSRLRRLAFVAHSAALFRSLGEHVPLATRRCEVIPPPMAFPRPDPAAIPARPDCPHFLFVGRLQAIKGVDVLLRAARRAAQAGKRFRVTLVGDGPDGEALRAEFGAEPWVRFVGHVPNAEVGGWMMSADALCAPSVFPEPFGLVVYQAVSLGVPVLASDAGGIPEMVSDGQNGRLIPLGDEAAWERVLGELCDPERLRALKDHAARSAGAYDPDVLGERMVALYRDTAALPA